MYNMYIQIGVYVHVLYSLTCTLRIAKCITSNCLMNGIHLTGTEVLNAKRQAMIDREPFELV